MTADPAVGLALAVAGVFLVAGAVKGALGLGLPPIAMGLLVLAMPPVEAAALMVVPAFLTNVWQGLAGPHLRALLVRLWLPFAVMALATLLSAGLMAPERAGIARVLLGLTLAAYAVFALARPDFRLDGRRQRRLGPAAGAATGVLTAATGVSAMPIVPFLQALGLDRDGLVQALGLSFTVSALALSVNLLRDGVLLAVPPGLMAAAVGGVFAGLLIGVRLRRCLSPTLFRRIFLAGLLLLGVYLAATAML